MTYTHAVFDSQNNNISCHSPSEAAAQEFIKSIDAQSMTLHVISIADAELFDKWTPHVKITTKGQTAAIVKDEQSSGYFDFIWADAREKRDRLLSASDWTQANDSPLTAAQKTAWAVYRQRLRDITTQADPAAVVWPVVPD